MVTDSQLMLNSMTKWLPGWKKKGWKTSAGQPVKNQDLLTALDAEVKRHARCAGTGCAGTRPALPMPTRRSTTARTSSRSRPPQPPGR